MSNKIYRFINKLTIPFKYSILCNPGFLLGNISDAGIKQVLAMSQKYGTTVSEEIKRMANAVKHVVQINNSFDRVYNKYIGLFELVESKLPPEEKIPSLVMNNKTAYTKFINFVNKNKDAFTKNERFIINAYVFLNRKQVTSVLGQNAEDVIARQNKIDMSEYIDPKNPISRLFTGKSNYDSKQISSWGIFMNNPIINAIMKKSEQIESLARSSALLNDLEHNYNSLGELFSDINKYMAPKDVRKKLNFKNREFGVKVQEAINATYNSNFDYENMPFLMDAASTVIPFPTFFLKNIGYWLDIIVNNPQVLDKAIRIQQGLWSSVDEEELKEDEFKAEAKGRGAIPLDVTNLPKLNDFFKGIYKPAPLNSLFSMFNLMQEPIPNLAYRINPLFSLATIPFQDSESVRYRPYNSDLYQPNIKKDNPEFNNLNYLFHRLNPYDRLIGNALRLPNKISNDSLQLADLTSSMFQPDF